MFDIYEYVVTRKPSGSFPLSTEQLHKQFGKHLETVYNTRGLSKIQSQECLTNNIQNWRDFVKWYKTTFFQRTVKNEEPEAVSRLAHCFALEMLRSNESALFDTLIKILLQRQNDRNLLEAVEIMAKRPTNELPSYVQPPTYLSSVVTPPHYSAVKKRRTRTKSRKRRRSKRR